MINRRSICSFTSNSKASKVKTNLKKPFLTRRLLASGASTKASTTKDFSECIENGSERERKPVNSFSISPTPKLNLLNRKEFQSDFVAHGKRQRPIEAPIREKKTRDLKCSKMSLELKNLDTNESDFFRLYYDSVIMNDPELAGKLSKVDCDNDCLTDVSQIALSIKYLEDQLKIAINENN